MPSACLAQHGFGPGQLPRRGPSQVGIALGLVTVLALAIAMSALAIGRNSAPGSPQAGHQMWSLAPAGVAGV